MLLRREEGELLVRRGEGENGDKVWGLWNCGDVLGDWEPYFEEVKGGGVGGWCTERLSCCGSNGFEVEVEPVGKRRESMEDCIFGDVQPWSELACLVY